MRSVTYSRKVLKRRAYDDALPETPSGRSIPARTGKRPKTIESGEQSLQSCLAHNDSRDSDNVSPSRSIRRDPQDGVKDTPNSKQRDTQPSTSNGSQPSTSNKRNKSNPVASSSKSFTRSSSLCTFSPEDPSASTPKKPARDLSQLFDLSPSPCDRLATPKTTGIAKRMLHRSHTDSSITTGRVRGLGTSRMSQANSILVSTRGSPSPTPTDDLKKLYVGNGPPSREAAHYTSGTAHAYTYAGKSRSFLVAVPTSKLGSLRQLDGMDEECADDFDVRESYTDLRSRWGVDISEDDPRSPGSLSPDLHGKRRGKAKAASQPLPPLLDDTANDLKSISELRSKGESRRFLDEVGYLFEGMDPSGRTSLRRASALEIVTKLCDVDFSRKVKATDFLSRAWDAFRESGGDKVLEAILAFFAALVARDPLSLSELAAKPDFISTLLTMLSSLDHERDALALVSSGGDDVMLKKIGVVKSEKASLTRLCDIISKSGLFSEGALISIPLLVSQALISLPPTCLLPHHVVTLCGSLMCELSLLPPRIDAYLAGLPVLPTSSSPSYPETPSLEHIVNCLYLLDSFLLRQCPQNGDVDLGGDPFADSDELADGLVALCVFTEALSTNDIFRDIAHKCTDVTLRVLVSLSHENRDWCQVLLRLELALPFIMRTIAKSHTQRVGSLSTTESPAESDEDLDRLCLALGLLTNLVQCTDEAKERCRELFIDIACAKRNCIRRCHCGNRTSALECLKVIYVQQNETGGKTSLSMELLRGHLAVLFGLLMRGSDANQLLILEALPGTLHQVKLESLLQEALEFVNFYTDLTTRVGATDSSAHDGSDMKPVPLWRDGTVERMVREGKSDCVAREVISFLRTLHEQRV